MHQGIIILDILDKASKIPARCANLSSVQQSVEPVSTCDQARRSSSSGSSLISNCFSSCLCLTAAQSEIVWQTGIGLGPQTVPVLFRRPRPGAPSVPHHDRDQSTAATSLSQGPGARVTSVPCSNPDVAGACHWLPLAARTSTPGSHHCAARLLAHLQNWGCILRD